MDELKIEMMGKMAQRLRGTGGGAQAEAVIKAIATIKSSPGMLDAGNRATAIYHLSVALSGEAHAVETIINTAAMLDSSS